ncbi:MAG: uroporphyrinogen-III C-methyltransferase [Rubrivivax sp.]|nr:uroporphyrinogen-III C-methyltransferase [Rubrivivax sp.]
MEPASERAPTPEAQVPPAEAVAATAAAVGTTPAWVWRGLLPVAVVLAALAAGALALSYSAQQRVKVLEAELVRRQQEATQTAGEARVLARQAETASREVAAKMALLEARVAETAMQRSQFEDLLQSLARSRDENVLADIEAAVRVAQQQSAITGSAEPMLLVLRQAEERLARYAQPRLERVRRAVAQDLERTRAAGGADLSVLASRLDDVMRQVDELPLLVVPQHAAARRGAAPGGTAAAGGSEVTAGAAPATASTATGAASASAGAAGQRWAMADTLRQAWSRITTHAWAETRALLRVTRIDDPQAMLIAPEQAYFLRENVKLRLLNARLALLSRQFDIAQSDLRESLVALERFFDRSVRRTTVAMDALRQVIAQARNVSLPRPDATLAAIAATSAGR